MDAHGVGVLDHLELVVVVDNETDTLSSIDPGLPQYPEVASLLARIPLALLLATLGFAAWVVDANGGLAAMRETLATRFGTGGPTGLRASELREFLDDIGEGMRRRIVVACVLQL